MRRTSLSTSGSNAFLVAGAGATGTDSPQESPPRSTEIQIDVGNREEELQRDSPQSGDPAVESPEHPLRLMQADEVGISSIQLMALRDLVSADTAQPPVLSGNPVYGSLQTLATPMATMPDDEVVGGGMTDDDTVPKINIDTDSRSSDDTTQKSKSAYHRTHAGHHLRAERRRAGGAGGAGVGGASANLDAASIHSNAGSADESRCPICSQALPKPLETQTLQIRHLKPRFLRELKRVYPYIIFHPSSRICVKDLHVALQSRIEQLLELDQTELTRLLDDAMRNLGEYEQQEGNWQKQFESGWTMGEKAADLVARFGGSWRFIGYLLSFLGAWAGINLLLPAVGSDKNWDPYPFILLNLMLSCIAALQAPIIMMSQNRQSQIDKAQNDYISKIILRAEHQVRHVNAKIDHLLSHQWKRLLEIQEIQIDLLQNLQFQNRRMTSFPSTPAQPGMTPSTPAQQNMDAFFQTDNKAARGQSIPISMPAGREIAWTVETVPDSHVRMLLSHRFGIHKPDSDDSMIFAHWHTDGDNFIGNVENVSFEVRGASRVLKRISYDISFTDPSATLDDVFAGEGSVTLRNDFDLKHMQLVGRLVRLVINLKDKPAVTFANGELPPRYKSSFFLKRVDKITEFFKTPIVRVNLSYAPPHQAAVLNLAKGQVVRRLRVDFYPLPHVTRANLLMKILEPLTPVAAGGVGGVGPGRPPTPVGGDAGDHPHHKRERSNHRDGASRAGPVEVGYLAEIVGTRPMPAGWKVVAHAEWPANNFSPVPAAGTGNLGVGVAAPEPGLGADVFAAEAGPVSVVLEENICGPGTWVFLCDETRVTFHGSVVEG
ncbi:hypothetical protein HK101_002535 [Irineochytrium annulatum]|nr:hypothetical protein HK101_002535 [Irineochytrium annulatum]